MKILNSAQGGIAVRKGQTVVISDNAGGGENKAVVTAVDTANSTFSVAYYEAAGQVAALGAATTVFIYGSEFEKVKEEWKVPYNQMTTSLKTTQSS